ncbi:MAG: hypothetical protein ACFFC3_04760 [Candidatus Odinarchaeota archaeon]
MEESEGVCAYATMIQPVHRTNKTELTIPVLDAYISEFDHEPYSIAIGAYDAIYHLKAAIEAVQSLNATEIINHWETWTCDNPRLGAGGKYAWWPQTHDLVTGHPYMYNLCTQWQPDGTKIVTQGFGNYDDSLATGNYTVAPWVHSAWL